MESKELAPRPLLSAPLAEVKEMASMAVKSGLIAIKSPEAAFFIIATGLELGLSPMQSLRAIHIIEGKPVLSASLLVALAKRHPDCEYFRLVSSSPTEATFETKRRGDPAATRKTWTMQDAQRAQLAGRANWQKHPTAMLEARCSAALARAVYPDLLLGVYEESEGDEIRQGARLDKEPGPVIDLPPAPDLQAGADKIEKYRDLIAGSANLTTLKSIGEALKLEPPAVGEAVREEYRAALKSLSPAKSLNPTSPKIPAQNPGPEDFDKAEEKRVLSHEESQRRIEQAKATSQKHGIPPETPAAPTLTSVEMEILDAINRSSSHSELDRAGSQLAVKFVSPAAEKFLRKAAQLKREKLVAKEEGPAQLGDPKF